MKTTTPFRILTILCLLALLSGTVFAEVVIPPDKEDDVLNLLNQMASDANVALTAPQKAPPPPPSPSYTFLIIGDIVLLLALGGGSFFVLKRKKTPKSLLEDLEENRTEASAMQADVLEEAKEIKELSALFAEKHKFADELHTLVGRISNSEEISSLKQLERIEGVLAEKKIEGLQSVAQLYQKMRESGGKNIQIFLQNLFGDKINASDRRSTHQLIVDLRNLSEYVQKMHGFVESVKESNRKIEKHAQDMKKLYHDELRVLLKIQGDEKKVQSKLQKLVSVFTQQQGSKQTHANALMVLTKGLEQKSESAVQELAKHLHVFHKALSDISTEIAQVEVRRIAQIEGIIHHRLKHVDTLHEEKSAKEILKAEEALKELISYVNEFISGSKDMSARVLESLKAEYGGIPTILDRLRALAQQAFVIEKIVRQDGTLIEQTGEFTPPKQ